MAVDLKRFLEALLIELNADTPKMREKISQYLLDNKWFYIGINKDNQCIKDHDTQLLKKRIVSFLTNEPGIESMEAIFKQKFPMSHQYFKEFATINNLEEASQFYLMDFLCYYLEKDIFLYNDRNLEKLIEYATEALSKSHGKELISFSDWLLGKGVTHYRNSYVMTNRYTLEDKNGAYELNDYLQLMFYLFNDDYIQKNIETYIQEKLHKTYEDGKLGIWLADQKRNYLNVQELDNEVEYLIIKQAIATGWDAPRAKILIKIRENMGEAFTIQTIGRIRRMPEPFKGHYDVDVLDNAYLYTFDVDFLNGAFTQKGVGAPTPLLNRKDVAKDFRLISERVLNLHEGQNEKAIRENLYQGLVREWNLTEDVELNKQKLENQGLQFGSSIINTYKQGRFDTLEHSDRLQDRERHVEADYRANRLDLLHVYHEIDRVTHLKVSQVEALLKRFLWMINAQISTSS